MHGIGLGDVIPIAVCSLKRARILISGIKGYASLQVEGQPKKLQKACQNQLKVAGSLIVRDRNWYYIFLAGTIFQAPKLSILSSPWRLLGKIAVRRIRYRRNNPPFCRI